MFLSPGKRSISNSARDFFQRTSLKAVVGASADTEKFGNKVLRCLMVHHYDVVPVNKTIPIIEDMPCVKNLNILRDIIDKGSTFKATKSMKEVGLSIITPPAVTLDILKVGVELGVRYYFLQPGTVDTTTKFFIDDKMKECVVVQGCVLQELGC